MGGAGTGGEPIKKSFPSLPLQTNMGRTKGRDGGEIDEMDGRK
jgi:hypothetical protein